MELTGSVTLVTGGSGAIGREVVEEVARRGSDVAVGYHTDEAGATAAVEAARELGRSAKAIGADVTDEDEAARLVEEATELGSLQGLVNGAGVTDPRPLAELSADHLSRMLAVNVVGTHNVTRPAIERMVEREGGRVVTVGSVAADTGFVDSSYAASKGGLAGYTRGVAREFAADGVLANVVAPGPVDSAMNDDVIEFLDDTHFRGHETVDTLVDRYEAQPGEIARAVGYLLESDFVTGEVLHVDGGMSL